MISLWQIKSSRGHSSERFLFESAIGRRTLIQIRRSNERGHNNFGWLDTFHTFSFGSYHDPDHTGFGSLRVLNEDRVLPGGGFPRHGHRDMEIISYVVNGTLAHRDSTGTVTELGPGHVQMMSAGTGITHSELNASAETPVHFLQIWIEPREQGLEPRHAEKRFPESRKRGRLLPLVSPEGRAGTLAIAQDVTLLATVLEVGEEVSHEPAPGRRSWVQVVRGAVDVAGTELLAGDGAAVAEVERLRVRARESSELLLFDLS